MAKDQKRQEADVLDEVRILRERIDKECTNSEGWTVVSLLESFKVLEKQELDIQSQHNAECSRLQQEIDELDKMLQSGSSYEDSDTFHRSLQDSNERLQSAKKELAAKLRSILSLKRQLDEVPLQAELMQYPPKHLHPLLRKLTPDFFFLCETVSYMRRNSTELLGSCFPLNHEWIEAPYELRFSELNTQIQKKHRQTRKHYDTYNALLEIKELMLKETSLLNSIDLQFQNAITSADGRIKLINTLEGILSGTQQKLEKVQLALESEQKNSDAVKEKYTAAVSEQRQSLSLLKLFQEECTKNERLRSQIHGQGII